VVFPPAGPFPSLITRRNNIGLGAEVRSRPFNGPWDFFNHLVDQLEKSRFTAKALPPGLGSGAGKGFRTRRKQGSTSNMNMLYLPAVRTLRPSSVLKPFVSRTDVGREKEGGKREENGARGGVDEI